MRGTHSSYTPILTSYNIPNLDQTSDLQTRRNRQAYQAELSQCKPEPLHSTLSLLSLRRVAVSSHIDKSVDAPQEA